MPLPAMLEKSENSMKSALKLASSKDSSFWNSSIHCSYYSLLQMMIHLLTHVKNPPVLMDDLVNKGDTHMRIRDALLLEIKSPTERSSFMRGFDALKKMRVRADYSSEQFDQTECLDFKQRAEALRNKARSYFK